MLQRTSWPAFLDGFGDFFSHELRSNLHSPMELSPLEQEEHAVATHLLYPINS